MPIGISIHQMTSKWQKCPDVAFIEWSKEDHSTADQRLIYTHFRVWVMHIIEDPTMWNVE